MKEQIRKEQDLIISRQEQRVQDLELFVVNTTGLKQENYKIELEEEKRLLRVFKDHRRSI